MVDNCCLTSQQLREALADGRIISPDHTESQIQPGSFDARICDEIFILDTEPKGLFRGNRDETIYHTLLQLPRRQRVRESLTRGYEVKKGFSYLLPLEERVKLPPGQFVKSSPKSSFGRDFMHNRLLGDFNPRFDELMSQDQPRQLQLWLLLQPLAFNGVIYPGLRFSQFRWFKGLAAQLTPDEILQEYEDYPMLYDRLEDKVSPAEPVVFDGLEIRLDLIGRHSEGIVGLRARHNPTPIDYAQPGKHNAEDYFEPIKAGGKLRLPKGGHYLFASKEILDIPTHLSAELQKHSDIGIHGPLHFAGFIDNGFTGDLVFEVRSDEISDMALVDGMPWSKLHIFRTGEPDKTYGESIGSSYQGQVGPKPSKHFQPFDYAFAAKNYEKLDRLVLVQDTKRLLSHRSIESGFESIDENHAAGLFRDIREGFFHSRYDHDIDCNDKRLTLEPIPYVILFGDNSVYSFVRAKHIVDYGEQELFGKHSIGFGGHVTLTDKPDYVMPCIMREVFQEEVEVVDHSEPRLLGTLMAYDKPVDQRHFGLVYKVHVSGEVKLKERSAKTGRMVSLSDMSNIDIKPYETWSRLLIPMLGEFYHA
jgi:dCTP deaminase